MLAVKLVSCYVGVCVGGGGGGPSLIPDRLIMEQMLLVAVLHSNVGNEDGKLGCTPLISRKPRFPVSFPPSQVAILSPGQPTSFLKVCLLLRCVLRMWKVFLHSGEACMW